MYEPETPLEELLIVGYTDCLTPEDGPQMVSPIYRVKGRLPELFLVPPFKEVCLKSGTAIRGGLWYTSQEFRQAIADGDATEVAPPITPHLDHALWIDQEIQPRYGPEASVLNELDRIARSEGRLAWRSLWEGHYERALQHSRRAAHASGGKHYSAFLVPAVIHHLRGENKVVDLLRESARTATSTSDFMYLVSLISGSLQRKRVKNEKGSRRDGET